MEIPVDQLNDGRTIPVLGFGTGTAWYKDGGKGPFDSDLSEILRTTIERGFCHIDGAEAYGTEEEIGAAIHASGILRDKLFITTKVQDNISDITGAIDASLTKLKVEYVDLYLIHWPYFGNEDSDLQAAWKEMEKVQKSGKAKSIGVSNYLRPHLEKTLEVATVIPAVNQIEHHPYLQRGDGYIPWMQSKGIKVEAFKPLVALGAAKGGPLDEVVIKIAHKHGVTPDAVLLRWQIQKGVVPITTTRKTSRLADYATVFGLALSDAEMEEITSVGSTHHFRAWQKARFDPTDRS